jgi:hypothetical protein
LKNVDYLLITKFLDVSQDDARLQVCGQLVDPFLHLGCQFASLHFLLGRRPDGSKVVLMVVDSIRHCILRITLPVTVVIYYQVAGQPHQPICQIALLRIVLIERSVDPYKNFLGQVLGGVDAGRKTVREIEYPPRKKRNDFLPGDTVTSPRSSHEFRTINVRRSF